MLFKAAHKIHSSKLVKKQGRQLAKDPNYKSIYHLDKLPTTVGMLGFIASFTLLSLKVMVLPFEGGGSNSKPRQAEILLVDEGVKIDLRTDSIIIDHNHIDVDSIPSEWVSMAAQVNSVLRHASVGGNISAGLDDLEIVDASYDRQNFVFHSRGNPSWMDKMDDLGYDDLSSSEVGGYVDHHLNDYDVFAAKLCYIDDDSDPYGQWEYYRDSMEDLEFTYPNKAFVWWTMPIRTDGDANRDAFNNYVRDYAVTNNKILFDIADIESHDVLGGNCSTGSLEQMCPEYSDDGGHLNMGGRMVVAEAYWWLMARLAGWDGVGGAEPPNTIIGGCSECNVDMNVPEIVSTMGSTELRVRVWNEDINLTEIKIYRIAASDMDESSLTSEVDWQLIYQESVEAENVSFEFSNYFSTVGADYVFVELTDSNNAVCVSHPLCYTNEYADTCYDLGLSVCNFKHEELLAYQYVLVTDGARYDLDNNGELDWSDLLLFMQNYTTGSYLSKSLDFNNDSQVNLKDYRLLIMNADIPANSSS